MAILYLLCGIQGSGKTTYATNNQKRLNAKIISTDFIRKNFQPIEEKDVFPKAYELAASYLKQGINVIFDATNITKKVRKRNKEAIENLLNCSLKTICLYLKTKLETCIERVSKRNAIEGEIFIPLEVISRYEENFELPTIDEGFSEVIVIE